MNPLPGVLCPMNGVALEGAFEDDGLLWNIPCCCLCKLVSSPRMLCTPPDSLPGSESSEGSIGRPVPCKGGSKCEGPDSITFDKGGASETVVMLDKESLRLEAVESNESLLDFLYAMCLNKHQILSTFLRREGNTYAGDSPSLSPHSSPRCIVLTCFARTSLRPKLLLQ